MAESTCIKCGNHEFESVVASPRDSPFKLTFVQCASCGGVIGAMDLYNIGEEIQQLKEQLISVYRWTSRL
jgi:hypothetical protein